MPAAASTVSGTSSDLLAAPRDARPLAIEHATVIPMDTERRLPDHTVVVRDGRIAWIGPATADAAGVATSGAMRVDARGRFVMPGLADMHVHVLHEVDLLLLLRHGVTSIRNMAGMPRHLRWREEAKRDGTLVPSIFTASPIVDGRPTMRLGSVPIETETEADAAVARVRSAGYDAVKVYDHLSRRGYDAVTAAARANGLPVMGHVPFMVGLDHALAAGQRAIEHTYGYVEAMQPPGSPLRDGTVEPSAARQALMDAKYEIDDERILDLASATADAGTWNCPTLMIRRRHEQTLEELVARPEMRWVDPLQMERWRQFKLTYPYGVAHKAVELEVQRRLVRALHALGAGLLIGTDAPVHHLVHGASLHEELEQFVRAGLTAYETLAIATRRAAAFLGESDVWGAVAPGWRADLLVLDADPLADIANVRRIAGVVLRGNWLELAELDARLDRAVARRAAELGRSNSAKTDVGAARFVLSWGHFALGTEDVTTTSGNGGHTVRASAEINASTGRGLLGSDGGTYRTELVFDSRGIARRATSEAVTADGPVRTTLLREGAHVSVRSEGGFVASEGSDWRDVSDATLFGRPDTAFFAELARRVRSLRPGERSAVDLLGPGDPPDGTVLLTHVEVERAGDEYVFTARRPNGFLSGVLRLGPDGELAEIVFGGRPSEVSQRAQSTKTSASQAPPLIVRRVPAMP